MESDPKFEKEILCPHNTGRQVARGHTDFLWMIGLGWAEQSLESDCLGSNSSSAAY